jgi:hypothetical protein
MKVAQFTEPVAETDIRTGILPVTSNDARVNYSFGRSEGRADRRSEPVRRRGRRAGAVQSADGGADEHAPPAAPRQARLAGKAENWPLAGYALKELRQGLFVISRAVPRWKGLPVPDLFDAAMSQPLATPR